MGIKLNATKTPAVPANEIITNLDFIEDVAAGEELSEADIVQAKADAAQAKLDKKFGPKPVPPPKEPKPPKPPKEPKPVKVKIVKPKPTCGVFLITNPDKSYKAVGVSSRIEVCWKDYSNWLAKGVHANVEMQKAYDACKGNLTITIAKICNREDLPAAKKEVCKANGIDIKLAFSGEVIKAADIVVPVKTSIGKAPLAD